MTVIKYALRNEGSAFAAGETDFRDSSAALSTRTEVSSCPWFQDLQRLPSTLRGMPCGRETSSCFSTTATFQWTASPPDFVPNIFQWRILWWRKPSTSRFHCDSGICCTATRCCIRIRNSPDCCQDGGARWNGSTV